MIMRELFLEDTQGVRSNFVAIIHITQNWLYKERIQRTKTYFLNLLRARPKLLFERARTLRRASISSADKPSKTL